MAKKQKQCNSRLSLINLFVHVAPGQDPMLSEYIAGQFVGAKGRGGVRPLV